MAKPTEPNQTDPIEPTAPAGNDPADPAHTEPNDGDVKDSHGQPGINKERHDREVAELNAKISELQAKVDEASKTEATAQELRDEIATLKSTLANNEVRHALEGANCVDVDLALSALGNYDGDVNALREAKPYLFEEKKNVGQTGFKPLGIPNAEKELSDKLDKAFGLI